MKLKFLILALGCSNALMAQKMTPEMLWSVKRVSASYVSPDGRRVLVASRSYDLKSEKGTTRQFFIDLATGKQSPYNEGAGKQIFQQDAAVWYASDEQYIYRSTDEGRNWDKVSALPEGAENLKISPDGKYLAFSRTVLVKPTLAKDVYKDMSKSSAQIYTDLNYRHWDTWSDGTYSHLFVQPIGFAGKETDLLEGMPYDCPQKPHGGAEDFTWSPDSRRLVYVCKKKAGKEYALSTNTDIYAYDLNSAATSNLTEGMNGYDMNPSFNADGTMLAFTSMKTDGFEADKNDIVLLDLRNKYKRNLTAHWDETVGGFRWSNDGNSIYFTAPWKGTEQLFSVQVPGNLMSRNLPLVSQMSNGDFDIAGIVGETKREMIVTRTDWNHAAEVFAVDKSDASIRQISHVNDNLYAGIRMSKIAKRYIKTTDGKQEFAWVIYPPDFNPAKKYPTLLYCQGGPQGALSQFYSFRWNFQLMAAQGYIVIAPNRRGMPGWGTKWNADISKDWGGQPMDDYLSAIDDISRESYVDKKRLGCIGASYGGYSVFMLAGIHNNRFKTFISHCGLFDLKSWYGTTEELWFANWDIGGDYWSGKAARSYEKFSPSNYVQNWNTPIMIIQGGKDFRVPIEQGQQAFQAAQLKGLKSKFLYFPNENHWILHAQNAIVWQREFFGWLKETL
jgi:dipeptidyl aminopeptidase/acylaminoacyl peptidase